MSSGAISRAVTDALKDAELLPRDAAAVALAKKIAQTLDDMDDDTLCRMIGQTGGVLLRTLESLGMTPAGRREKKKEGAQDAAPVASKLDELRARRADRAR